MRFLHNCTKYFIIIHIWIRSTKSIFYNPLLLYVILIVKCYYIANTLLKYEMSTAYWQVCIIWVFGIIVVTMQLCCFPLVELTYILNLLFLNICVNFVSITISYRFLPKFSLVYWKFLCSVSLQNYVVWKCYSCIILCSMNNGCDLFFLF